MSPIERSTDVIDLTRAPHGELVAARLVAAVAEVGDLAERHYLEIKGPPDLSSKVHIAKIAKFILGAANRLPERAAEAFGGFGVMIVGIADSGIKGVPPVEMLALSQVIQPFLGAAGPRWDVVRVPVENSTNEVLVILVDPPQIGQLPFSCRANGDKLQNGRIYYRGDGDTREATADELDMLMARGAARTPAPVELGVAVTGAAVPMIVDDERTLVDFIAKERRRLLDALPKPSAEELAVPDAIRRTSSEASRNPIDPLARFGTLAAEASRLLSAQGLGVRGVGSLLGTEVPDTRSAEAYHAEIDAWEIRFRKAWPHAVEQFASFLIEANELTVVNKTQTFMHDVEVKLHLAGTVEVLERQRYGASLRLRDVDLPLPPRKWGPTKRHLGFDPAYSTGLAAPASSPSTFGPGSFRPPDASWKTTGSVDTKVLVRDLRPESSFASGDGDSILILRDDVPEIIHGSWTATARGYNEVFKGTIEVKVAEPTHLTELIRDFLGLN